jgi:hypothetical protein
MDNLIDKEFGGDVQRLPIRSFKVFSEDAQVGRSDSAVLYLSKPLHDEDVQKVVTYLNNALRDRMVDIKVVGASTMGQSLIQGVTVPDKALQIKVTGKGTTSNGKLVANILSMAYLQASLGKIGYISQETLTQRAMFYANEIWNELHGQDAARIPFVTED